MSRPPSVEAAPRGVPRRPRLTCASPALWRSQDDLQVGEGDDAVVLLRVPPKAADVVDAFDGTRTRDEVAALVGVEAPLVDALVTALHDAGLLSDGRPPRRPQLSARVCLVGAGILGRTIAETLVDEGVRDLVLVDGSPTDVTLYPDTPPKPTAAQALAAWLRPQADATRLSTASHWPSGVGEAHLTVVTTDFCSPDRGLLDVLARQDAPHLVAHPTQRGAAVGPLVIPGTSACVRCADLSRTRYDAAWGWLAAQLSRYRRSVSPTASRWVGVHAGLQAARFLRCGTSELIGQTWLLDESALSVSQRLWPLHPECGCTGLGSVADLSDPPAPTAGE